MNGSRRVIVIGAGAAGLMAAVAAAQSDCSVTVLERNEKAGKKIYITGKGRCNLTNACETADFFDHVVRNPRFLYSSIYQFDQSAVMEFFESCGCPLKTERGERVFPVSDHASDVTAALLRRGRELGIRYRYHTEVSRILTEETESGIRACGVETSTGERLTADAVILCTGGLSYPSTGSDGAGLRMAADLGLKVTDTAPSLVPFVVREPWCGRLSGLSLRNVSLKIVEPGKRKPVYEGFGEMLFTHFGISGPLVLTASCVCDFQKVPQYRALLDLKPALPEEKLRARIDREVEAGPRRSPASLLRTLLPARLAETVLELIEQEGSALPANNASLSGSDRARIVSMLKSLPMTVTGTRGYNEAVVTRGGISVREFDPSTMECRKIRGLYAAGEVLDVDAHTGGFNLQIAWSTGHLAGASIQ